MGRTYTVRNIAIPSSILAALETKKLEEGRLGSLTAYTSEILSRYVSGALVSEELLRLKIEAEIRAQGREIPAPAVQVKAHRPAKEKYELRHKKAI